MKNDLFIKHGITIPEHELEISSSRAGGPGGQHVNKTNSKITVRFNIAQSSALPEFLKARVIEKLATQLTSEGDLVVHNSESRSQQQNKELALARLALILRQALHIPKKRIATKIPHAKQEARLQNKTQRSSIKKMRSKKIFDE
jgi:ribosome-associated protein